MPDGATVLPQEDGRSAIVTFTLDDTFLTDGVQDVHVFVSDDGATPLMDEYRYHVKLIDTTEQHTPQVDFALRTSSSTPPEFLNRSGNVDFFHFDDRVPTNPPVTFTVTSNLPPESLTTFELVGDAHGATISHAAGTDTATITWTNAAHVGSTATTFRVKVTNLAGASHPSSEAEFIIATTHWRSAEPETFHNAMTPSNGNGGMGDTIVAVDQDFTVLTSEMHSGGYSRIGNVLHGATFDVAYGRWVGGSQYVSMPGIEYRYAANAPAWFLVDQDGMVSFSPHPGHDFPGETFHCEYRLAWFAASGAWSGIKSEWADIAIHVKYRNEATTDSGAYLVEDRTFSHLATDGTQTQITVGTLAGNIFDEYYRPTLPGNYTLHVIDKNGAAVTVSHTSDTDIALAHGMLTVSASGAMTYTPDGLGTHSPTNSDKLAPEEFQFYVTTLGRDEHDNVFTQSSNQGNVKLEFEQVNRVWVDSQATVVIAAEGKTAKMKFVVHAERFQGSSAAIRVGYEVFRETLDAEAISFDAQDNQNQSVIIASDASSATISIDVPTDIELGTDIFRLLLRANGQTRFTTVDLSRSTSTCEVSHSVVDLEVSDVVFTSTTVQDEGGGDNNTNATANQNGSSNNGRTSAPSLFISGDFTTTAPTISTNVTTSGTDVVSSPGSLPTTSLGHVNVVKFKPSERSITVSSSAGTAAGLREAFWNNYNPQCYDTLEWIDRFKFPSRTFEQFIGMLEKVYLPARGSAERATLIAASGVSEVEFLRRAYLKDEYLNKGIQATATFGDFLGAIDHGGATSKQELTLGTQIGSEVREIVELAKTSPLVARGLAQKLLSGDVNARSTGVGPEPTPNLGIPMYSYEISRGSKRLTVAERAALLKLVPPRQEIPVWPYSYKPIPLVRLEAAEFALHEQKMREIDWKGDEEVKAAWQNSRNGEPEDIQDKWKILQLAEIQRFKDEIAALRKGVIGGMQGGSYGDKAVKMTGGDVPEGWNDPFPDFGLRLMAGPGKMAMVFQDELLRATTGAGYDLHVLDLIRGAVALGGRDPNARSDEWYLQQPGRWPFDLMMSATNPLSYTPMAFEAFAAESVSLEILESRLGRIGGVPSRNFILLEGSPLSFPYKGQLFPSPEAMIAEFRATQALNRGLLLPPVTTDPLLLTTTPPATALPANTLRLVQLQFGFMDEVGTGTLSTPFRITPQNAGVKSIAEHPLLHRIWEDSIRDLYYGTGKNGKALRDYLDVVGAGGTPTANEARAAFNSVRRKFIDSVETAVNAGDTIPGYVFDTVHHWNWPLGDHSFHALDPRQLFPMSENSHSMIHVRTTIGPVNNPLDIYFQPINPLHRIDFDFSYPLAPRTP